MIGQTISHYKILSELGEGGMGVVSKAEDTKLKRTVALKFLPPELTRDKSAKTRFIHEAQAASALQHNNICAIHEIDETKNERLFVAMDCYDFSLGKVRLILMKLTWLNVDNVEQFWYHYAAPLFRITTRNRLSPEGTCKLALWFPRIQFPSQ